ncbi:MAG: cbb3-type cytochrome c oxidase N-terminal domain-containing protein [Gallionella sp.]|nr:cbb3-type cytochrome c oxidase N-terminal domain-containing protein [Gallionella sp.]
MSDNQNSAGGVPTTGHVWDDDLGDLTNQPPRWWMLGLTASAVWVVVYWLMYPSIPFATSGDYFKGIGLPATGQWSAIKELAEDQAVLDGVRKPYEDKLKGMTPAAILADSELSEYVTRSGKVLFSDNCGGCHGQNGVGSEQKGAKFAVREQGLMAPVLLDDDWLFGGKIDDVHTSITGGRQGMMSAHKDVLSAAEIDTLANAVAAGSPTSTPLFAEKGCTACHGADGKGIAAMGSANLTDKIWRFDGSLEGIKQTITYGVNSGDANARVAVMPNFSAAGKLSEVDMKKLAVYVYKFGGGQAEAVAAPVVEAAAVSAVADAASAPEAK